MLLERTTDDATAAKKTSGSSGERVAVRGGDGGCLNRTCARGVRDPKIILQFLNRPELFSSFQFHTKAERETFPPLRSPLLSRDPPTWFFWHRRARVFLNLSGEQAAEAQAAQCREKGRRRIHKAVHTVSFLARLLLACCIKL